VPKANNLITISKLNHTWLIDLDGTILKHNAYLNGQDELLPGVKVFFDSIPSTDFIILLSARSSEYKKTTEDFLSKMSIRYDQLVFDLPKGERVLINDQKPGGLNTAIAVNLDRDFGLSSVKINIVESI